MSDEYRDDELLEDEEETDFAGLGAKEDGGIERLEDLEEAERKENEEEEEDSW